MQQETIFKGVDILEEFYLVQSVNPEIDESTLTVDVEKYYGKTCCIKIVAVDAGGVEKRVGVEISADRKSIYYTYFNASSLWLCDPQDSFTYIVEDTHSGKQVTASISLRGLVRDPDFSATDIQVNLGDKDPLKIQLDTSVFNKSGVVQILRVGAVNSRFIRSVSIHPTQRSSVIIELEHGCSAWDKAGASTDFTYTIVSSAFPNKRAFAKITFSKQEVADTAIDIMEFVHEPLPESVFVEFAERYREAGLSDAFELTALATTPTERGVAVMGEQKVSYSFNLDSGYWDNPHAKDVLRYSKRNTHTNKTSSAYLIITKCENTDEPIISGVSSGYGGSGLGEGLLDGSELLLDNITEGVAGHFVEFTMTNVYALSNFVVLESEYSPNYWTEFHLFDLSNTGPHNGSYKSIEIGVIPVGSYRLRAADADFESIYSNTLTVS